MSVFLFFRFFQYWTSQHSRARQRLIHANLCYEIYFNFLSQKVMSSVFVFVFFRRGGKKD